MKERVTSGAALVFLLAAVVVFNHSFRLALNIAIAVVSLLGVYEIISALGLTKCYILMAPSLILQEYFLFFQSAGPRNCVLYLHGCHFCRADILSL